CCEIPCTTATGRSANCRTGSSPTALTSSASASVPSTSTGAPAGSVVASSRAALCALVTTSSAAAAKPSDRRCSATSPGARDALLVTYRVRAATVRTDSTAPGVGSCPLNTVPSKSSSRQSWCCATEFTSAELRHPVLGVGGARHIGGRRVQKPLQRLVAAAQFQQG